MTEFTELNRILSRAEEELRAGGTVTVETCSDLKRVNQATRGLEKCLAFIGCENGTLETSGDAVSPALRCLAIRLTLLRLGAHTSSPRWSSKVLEAVFDAGLSSPGAQIGDFVQALFDVLSETAHGLSDAQRHLIRDFGIQVVGRHRRLYGLEDLSWLASTITARGADLTPAQAYLAAYILPPALVSLCRSTILNALEGTSVVDEVARMLEDD